jgi:hypothetical protein
MPPESHRILNFFDWSGGIRDRRTNPLAFPQNALMAGENVELLDRGLRTRRGTSITSSGSLPQGEVMSLAQVRFPSNETSYLVAQVRDSGIAYEFPPAQSPPASRIYHAACYDPENNYIWVFGGCDVDGNTYYNDLWYWDCEARTWHEVTDATNPPGCTATNDMVYDAAEGRLILYVGRTYEPDGTLIGSANMWMAYYIGANSWEEIEVTSPGGCLYSGMTNWREHSRMILRDRTIWLMGGKNDEGSFYVTSFCTFNVDTGEYSGILPENYEEGPAARYGHAIAWNDTDSELMLVGGYSELGYQDDAWKLLHLGESWVWIQLNDLPVDGETHIENGALIYCSGKYWAIGTSVFDNLTSPGLSDVAWVYVDGDGDIEWLPCQFVNEPDGRSYVKAIVEGTNIWLVMGASTTYDPETNDLVLIEGAELLSDMCEWEPTTGGAAIVTSRLWASNDRLPTTTATFTEIYDLGDADRVSFAVLNDRVVITEGKAAPPLVWGGCMEDDASDWMYPKAVLVSQDGSNFYDISAQVLDKDVDNAAGIGGISSTGFIAVCTDMPIVEGFFFEMETVNAVGADVEATTYQARTVFDVLDTFTQADFKRAIDHWVQDSGTTGHFEDASNNPLTLGEGNTCPDVIPGVVVNFAAGDRVIVAITDDGEGSGQVMLDANQANATVPSISGLVMSEDSEVCVKLGHTDDVSVWSVTPDTHTRYGGYSLRVVVRGADIAAAGDSARLTLKAGDIIPDMYGSSYGHWCVKYNGSFFAGGGPLAISHVSIVEMEGNSANGNATPTEVTFPRSYRETIPWHYRSLVLESAGAGTKYGEDVLGVNITAVIRATTPGQTFVSDPLPFEIDPLKDYLVTIDIIDTWFQPIAVYQLVWTVPGVSGQHQWVWPAKRRGGIINLSAGEGFYFKAEPNNAAASYDQQDVTGFSLQPGYTPALIDISTQIPFPVLTDILVGHTTDTTRLDVSAIEDFRSLVVENTVPSGTAVYWALSLDGRSTFQVFKSDAWKTVVREEAGVWQYLDAADEWQAASVDTLLQALKEAFAISGNRMVASEFAAMSASDWTATGGVQVRVTSTLDLAFGLVASETATPKVIAYMASYNDAGDTTISGWKDGSWKGGDGWTDNTRLEAVPWGQSGTIMYDGETGFEGDYSVLNEVPGFWYRFMCNGTSADAAVTRILYKARCQPLANIGDGQPDIPLAMIFHDVSKDAKKDITIEVSGAQGSFTTDEDGDVTYTAGRATIPMATDDYLYVGYVLKFGQIEVTPYEDYGNTTASVLSAEYWTGKSWAEVDIVDNTGGDDGKALSTKGKIFWTPPDDWKMLIPFDANFPRGYYIRFKVSVGLTSTTAIDEVRIYAVPDELTKHRFAVSFRDRIALVSRPDAPDQVDISRALEEYGFVGSDSGSYRVGGQDSIQCAISAWNGLFLGKTETWHQLIGQTPENFAFESVEAARHIPLNSRVIVKAPVAGIDAGTRYGLFYINRFGAFVSTGLHTDTEWNTGRGALLSEAVNWWDEGAMPRLALNSLHKACGEYWPVKNWIVWAVPMITEKGQTSQPTNNRLIIYDVGLGAWLPPFTISIASLAAAYHYNEDAPGKIGEIGLYGGDYQGRIIRLFSSQDTTDLGEPIAAWLETGWLHLGSPEWVKLIRRLQVYGRTIKENAIVLKIWTDGSADTEVPSYTLSLDSLNELGSTFFSSEEESLNARGRFFKFRIEFQDVTHIFGMQIGMSPIREWGAC